MLSNTGRKPDALNYYDLCAAGIRIVYGIYQFSKINVPSYIEGSYVVFVPWNAFKADLSREGAAIFGGARPKSDGK